jgi:hypothetical protein
MSRPAAPGVFMEPGADDRGAAGEPVESPEGSHFVTSGAYPALSPGRDPGVGYRWGPKEDALSWQLHLGAHAAGFSLAGAAAAAGALHGPPQGAANGVCRGEGDERTASRALLAPNTRASRESSPRPPPPLRRPSSLRRFRRLGKSQAGVFESQLWTAAAAECSRRTALDRAHGLAPGQGFGSLVESAIRW